MDDLWHWLVYFWGLDLEETPHRPIVELLQLSVLEPEKPNVMVIVPRGWYKTSIFRGFTVWKQARKIFLKGNPFHRIVIASATLALARTYLDGIAAVLRAGGLNGRLLDHFPERLWRERDFGKAGSKVVDSIYLAPRLGNTTATIVEPSIFIGSLRRISTGFHADEALVDDINNAENVMTDFQRKKVQKYYNLLFPIVGTNDRDGEPSHISFIATPWHDDDVRGAIIREEAAQLRSDPQYESPWRIYQKNSLEPDGSAAWPSKYPLERLERLRVHMGPREFAANYLCDPVGDNEFVDERLIRWKSFSTFPALRLKRIAIDPNQHTEAKEMGCWAAVVACGFDQFNHMYVEGAWGSRTWGTHQIIQKLFELHDQFPDHTILCEDAHMGHFQGAVHLEEARRSQLSGKLVRLPIWYVPVDVRTSKYQRWQRIGTRFHNGTVTLADEIAPDIKAEIKDELVRGPVARFKDFNDALALAEAGFRPKYESDAIPPEEPPIDPNAPVVLRMRDAWGDETSEVFDG